MHRQLLGVTCLFSWMLSLPVLAQDTHYSPALTSSIEITEQHRIIPEELKKFIPEPDRFKYLPKELQNRLIVQLKEMIDAEKVWAQQIATPTESSFPDQQSSRSQFEKNIEQISSTLLSQYPLHQKFEKLILLFMETPQSNDYYLFSVSSHLHRLGIVPVRLA